MASPSSLRRAPLLLLCAALATPWPASAAPQKASAKAAPAPLSLLDRTWSFLKSLWGEEGCRMDPSGRCITGVSQPPAPSTDTGCRMDPDGLCISGATQPPAPHTDTGCRLDPSGICIN